MRRFLFFSFSLEKVKENEEKLLKEKEAAQKQEKEEAERKLKEGPHQKNRILL